MSETVVILASDSPYGEGVDYDMSTPKDGEWMKVLNVDSELTDIGR